MAGVISARGKSAPRAVLFDLYNTLAPGGSPEHRDRVAERMAVELGVDPQALASLIRETFDARTRGLLGDLEATVAWLAAQLGAAPDEAAIGRAVELRLAMNRGLLRRTWAIDALEQIRATGLRIGLVTDCSAETPACWPDSPLARCVDAVSFSCVTGYRKPEPEAYLVTVDALGVRLQDCLFVGDGSSGELSGAAALGMRAIRFVPSGPELGEAVDEDATWTGPAVTRLHDILDVTARGPEQ